MYTLSCFLSGVRVNDQEQKISLFLINWSVTYLACYRIKASIKFLQKIDTLENQCISHKIEIFPTHLKIGVFATISHSTCPTELFSYSENRLVR